PELRLSAECFLFVSTGQNDVICPKKLIQGEEGETVSIRCRLDQPLDLQDEMISVRRLNLSEVVISYRDGKEYRNNNADSNRFSLNHEDLKGGILNLQISSVQLSDRGLYTSLCFIFLQVQRRWMFLLWSEVFLVLLLFLCSLLLESCGNVEESVSSKVLLFNISSVLWSLICLRFSSKLLSFSSVTFGGSKT
uniref:Immunoglobulin V-set domain-containing protein n=1 Tax=Echeneis naucrates TaxID=173247 RepID=A0A665TZU0_ECHNA